jgi:hypothetical protein
VILPICLQCGESHASVGAVRDTTWQTAEQLRFAWAQHGSVFPAEQALAPLRQQHDSLELNVYDKRGKDHLPRNRTKTLKGRWDDYHAWLVTESYQVRDKAHARFVTNLTAGPRRQEHNQRWADRIFVDCDGAGPPDAFLAFCSYYGIAAIFHESSSSIRKRTEAWLADQPDPGITGWHAELPLSERIFNDYVTEGRQVAKDLQHPWRHFVNESKRAHAHFTAIFSAFAGFGGVGGHCGFDLAPNQLTIPRFLGSRQHPEGPLPWIHRVPGSNAINLRGLLYSTGYQHKPLPPIQKAKVRTVRTRIKGTRAAVRASARSSATTTSSTRTSRAGSTATSTSNSTWAGSRPSRAAAATTTTAQDTARRTTRTTSRAARTEPGSTSSAAGLTRAGAATATATGAAT